LIYNTHYDPDCCRVNFNNMETHNSYGIHADSDTLIDLRNNLFILSAPSGTGKNTVFNEVKKLMPVVERAVTATTRSVRGKEKDGIDYYFLTEEDFMCMKELGVFVEWNRYDTGYYATLFSEIDKYPQSVPVFLIVDTNGMKNIKQKYPSSTSIFLQPPSMEELKIRIEKRGENSPEEIENRLNTAIDEVKQSRFYDYVIKNDEVHKTAERIVKIIECKLSQ